MEQSRIIEELESIIPEKSDITRSQATRLAESNNKFLLAQQLKNMDREEFDSLKQKLEV